MRSSLNCSLIVLWMKLFIYLRLSGFTLKFIVMFYKVSRKVNISYSFAGDWGGLILGTRLRANWSQDWLRTDSEVIEDKVDLYVSLISLKLVISVWCSSSLPLSWRSGRCASTRLFRETTLLFCWGPSFRILPVSSRTHRTVLHHDCSVRHLFCCMFQWRFGHLVY